MIRVNAPLHQRLSRALVQDEFEVNYQPLVELKTGRIAGGEALVRWRQNDGSLAFPDSFIPQSEQTGFIIRLDQWVLNEACRQFAQWRRDYDPNLFVAVNLSAAQFSHPLLLNVVQTALKTSGLASAGLELEVTESATMRDPNETAGIIKQLGDMGIALSLDDFGTGFSSLSYLHRFAFHTLKIDRSFIGDFSDKKRDSTIVSAIVALAHALGLNVVAEGIETADQLTFLRAADCKYGQGYLFGKAMSAEVFRHALETGLTYASLLHEPQQEIA